tara:strand:- start:610 stop:1308 length:699 start_codon:yes stop_codon:yes gene_type:complete
MAYTLANLQDDIRNYTEVDDSVLSNTLLSTIIKNAENRIYRDADSDDNRFYATSALVSGNRYVTIPTDLRFIRYAQLTDSNGKQTFLEKKDTSFMSEYYSTPNTASGIPKYYGNWDAEFWVVSPTPNAQFSITLAYVKQPISITNTTQPTAAPAATNGTYTSNKYQDLLLYACLVEAYGYLKGPADMLQYYEGSFKRALQSYAIEQQGRRRRDEYQDGAIRTPLKSESPSKY